MQFSLIFQTLSTTMEQQSASSATNTGITRYVAGLHILSKLLRLCNPGTKVLLACCFLMHILCKCKSCKCKFDSRLLNPDALFQCQGFLSLSAPPVNVGVPKANGPVPNEIQLTFFPIENILIPEYLQKSY